MNTAHRTRRPAGSLAVAPCKHCLLSTPLIELARNDGACSSCARERETTSFDLEEPPTSVH